METPEEDRNSNTRKFYRKIRATKTGYRPRTDNILKGKNGDLITNKGQIIKIWQDHFDSLLNRGARETEEPVCFQTAELPN